MSEFKTIELRAGKDKAGQQRWRRLETSRTIVSYELPEVIEEREYWNEETETFYTVDVQLRPHMRVETAVTRSLNKFGIAKLYGPQGL